MEKENTEQLLAVCSKAELQMSDGAGGGVGERRKWSSTAGVGNPWDSSCGINRSKCDPEMEWEYLWRSWDSLEKGP